MNHMRILSICVLSFVFVPSSYAFWVRNAAGNLAYVTARYMGETSFSCRPDVKIAISPGHSAEFYPGGCILQSIACEGCMTLNDPKGDRFVIDSNGRIRSE